MSIEENQVRNMEYQQVRKIRDKQVRNIEEKIGIENLSKEGTLRATR